MHNLHDKRNTEETFLKCPNQQRREPSHRNGASVWVSSLFFFLSLINPVFFDFSISLFSCSWCTQNYQETVMA